MPQFASTVPNPRQNISLRDRRQPVEEYEAERNAEELANLRLQHDMAWQQAFRDATDDPDNAKIIWDKVRSQTSTLPATEGAVKSAFTNYATGQVPQWSARFTDMQRAVKKKNLLDQSEINYETAIEVGNAEAARAALARQSTIDPGREAINKQRSLELDAAVPLRQAERALARGDIAGAKEAVRDLNTDDMTAGQRQAVARLKQTIAAAETDERRARYAEWTGMAASVRDLSAVERSAAISTIRAAVNSPENARRMSTEELRAFNSFLDRMGKGEEWDSDTMLYGDLMTEAMGLQDASPATMQAFRAKIDQSLVNQQLSSTDHRGLLKMATEKGAIPSTAMAGTINSAVASLVTNGLVDDDARLKYDVAQEVKEKGLTEKEAYELAFVKAAGGAYKVAQEEKMAAMPQGDIRDALTVLNAHNDNPEDPTHGNLIATAQDAINYLVDTGLWNDPRLRKSDKERLARAKVNIYGQGGKWPEPLDKPPPRKTSTSFPGGIPKQGAIPVVNTDAERDALPSGAVYIDPNGDKRTKP